MDERVKAILQGGEWYLVFELEPKIPIEGLVRGDNCAKTSERLGVLSNISSSSFSFVTILF